MPVSLITPASLGGVPAFSVYMSANQIPSNSVVTKCALDTKVIDTANCFNTSTYRFTPNVAGYYFISGAVAGYSTGTSLTAAVTLIYKNGAIVAGAQINGTSNDLVLQPSISQIVYLNGSTDYVELYGLVTASASSQLFIGTTQQYTTMTGCLVRAA